MGLRVTGFRPKRTAQGTAFLYCAQCIKMRVPNPLQAVTIFSGTALCPTHLQDYTQFQFLAKDGEDYSHLEVR